VSEVKLESGDAYELDIEDPPANERAPILLRVTDQHGDIDRAEPCPIEARAVMSYDEAIALAVALVQATQGDRTVRDLDDGKVWCRDGWLSPDDAIKHACAIIRAATGAKP
jgi:hypothetical protein